MKAIEYFKNLPNIDFSKLIHLDDLERLEDDLELVKSFNFFRKEDEGNFKRLAKMCGCRGFRFLTELNMENLSYRARVDNFYRNAEEEDLMYLMFWLDPLDLSGERFELLCKNVEVFMDMMKGRVGVIPRNQEALCTNIENAFSKLKIEKRLDNFINTMKVFLVS